MVIDCCYLIMSIELCYLKTLQNIETMTWSSGISVCLICGQTSEAKLSSTLLPILSLKATFCPLITPFELGRVITQDYHHYKFLHHTPSHRIHVKVMNKTKPSALFLSQQPIYRSIAIGQLSFTIVKQIKWRNKNARNC